MSNLSLFIALLFSINIGIFFFTQNENKSVSSLILFERKSPQIILSKFKLFEVDEKGSVKTTLSGSQGVSYQDGHYKIKDILLFSTNSNFVEKISGEYAFYKDKTMEVSGNITYKRSDGSELKTDRLSYYSVDDTFHIPNDFILRRNGAVVTGNTLYIKRESGIINALNIKATLPK
jgi:LPS export ABC transporter protein LptC